MHTATRTNSFLVPVLISIILKTNKALLKLKSDISELLFYAYSMRVIISTNSCCAVIMHSLNKSGSQNYVIF